MSDTIRFCENPECGARFAVQSGFGKGRGRRYCKPECRPKRSDEPTGTRVQPGTGSPATSDRQYDEEESAWLAACLAYRSRKRLRFLTCCDYLEVARSLGYEKCAAPDAGSGGSSASERP